MGYTALYRKLRPQNFNQVVGQEHIVKTLVNQIESGRITHAYLFCGTRGTGKTSTAKIFAKAVNCLHPIDFQPCNKCELCMAMNEGRSLNVIEIDAASNNGVENIREIREEVKYAPTEGKYKVYIIDEVHMLSIGAFNALLKTLEEPPAHVIFILATTDPQKIPVTILSRCQRFDFKRISNDTMVQTLSKYMQEENINIEPKAIDYIVKISDGAMRDALSILDQCISYYYGEEITLEKVLEVSGSVDDDVFYKIIDALAEMNSSLCMDIIDEIIQKGRDINQFLNELLVHLRNELIATTVDKDTHALDVSEDSFFKLKEQGLKCGGDFLIKLINDFSMLQSQLKYAFNSRILFEIACIKLCNAVGSQNLTDVFQKIKLLEKKLEETPKQVIYQNVNQINQQDENINIEEKPLREMAIPEDIQSAIDNWRLVLSEFKMIDRGYIENVTPASLEDDCLYLVCENDLSFDRFIKKEDEIKEKISNAFGKEYKVCVIARADYEKRKLNVLSQERKIPEINIEESLDKINFSVQIEDN